MKNEPAFVERLHRVVASKIQVAPPYKDMARALYRVAANPRSPLSPLSEESKYDNSSNSKKTFDLIDKTVPLIKSLKQMIMSPLAVSFRRRIVLTLKSFTPDLGQGSERKNYVDN